MKLNVNNFFHDHGVVNVVEPYMTYFSKKQFNWNLVLRYTVKLKVH